MQSYYCSNVYVKGPKEVIDRMLAAARRNVGDAIPVDLNLFDLLDEVWWKDDWDIKPIYEENAKDVIEQYWKGMTHRYVALMKSAPSLEMGCYFWGTEEDNPWNIQ